MNCKNINRKNKVIVLFIGILLLAGGYHLTQKKYQMYVFRYLEYLECGEYGEAESPLKKKVWFSAKQWLSDEKTYLKISDHDFINKNGIPMPDTDLFIQELYGILLHKKIVTEHEMAYERFVIEVKPTLYGRYLFSEFDRDTLRPTVHKFLVSFRLSNNSYETVLIWKTDKQQFSTFNIYNSGEYLKIYGTYNYQNYLKGEQPSEVK